MPVAKMPPQKVNLTGKILRGKDGRRRQMVSGQLVMLDGPTTPASRAATPSSPASPTPPTGNHLLSPPMVIADADGLAKAASRGLKVGVLRYPDGSLAVVHGLSGKNLLTDRGRIDMMVTQAGHDPKRLVKFGEMKAADVIRYRRENAKLANQPSGRMKEADADAGPIYSLVSSGLLTSEEAMAILGTITTPTPQTPHGRLRAMGFKDELIETIVRDSPASPTMLASPAAAPPMIPKPAKERKRRIDQLPDPRP